MNRAVIFYSLDGNTKDAAQKIAEALGAACIASAMPGRHKSAGRWSVIGLWIEKRRH